MSVLTELPALLAVSIQAEELPFGGWLTNSIFVAALVTALIWFLASKATKNMSLVPHPAQNAFEFVVEFLYGQVEGIVGKHVAPKVFPLLATMFLFILSSNWFGLLPGVGTVGFGPGTGGFWTVSELKAPLLRPATADLNMTLGMALLFMLVWFGITLREVGLVGFLKHTFAPKGGMTGLIGAFVAVVFFAVGVIELVSIAFRPVSLSLRLFGNIYAGEVLLHTMATLGDKLGPFWSFLLSIALPLPFYFMELLVGLLQAVVFSLLCAVYIKLSTAHDEEAGHGHEH
jgi:F-type H+-transporting ATPase subunit a